MPKLRSLPIILVAALATACAGQAVPEAAPARAEPRAQTAPVPPAPAGASLAEIAGDWDIVSFDGPSPPRVGPPGYRSAFVDIRGNHIRFSIGCNFFTMPVHVEAGALHRAPGFSSGSEKGCGPEPEALDRTLVGFLASGPKLGLLPDGRLRITAPGHELLLERAPTARGVTFPARRADEPAFSILMPSDLKLQPIESGVRIFKGGGIWVRFLPGSFSGWDLPGCPTTQPKCETREIIAGREARSVTVDVSMPGALYNRRSFYLLAGDGGQTYFEMMCAQAACPRAEAIIRSIGFAL